jgi:CheY-like chemotaxis protein
MQMPGMDGLALAVEIRKLRSSQELPLLLLTSLGQREFVGEVGITMALTKPVKSSQLYNALLSVLAQSVGQAESSPTSEFPAFDAQMGQRLPLRILLAEDNAINQKLALYMLERLGYRADLAANGLEVLQALQRQRYDVVLMDVVMPEMDGLEATRAILRDWATGERPRIIAMTANAMREDRETCLAAGMDDYLSKPIHIEELVNALNRCQPSDMGHSGNSATIGIRR